jgi:hypothetical protein
MTEDRVREIFHEELSHHALAGGIIDNVVERAVRNYAHDHVTTVSLTPGVAAGRDELRMLLHRLDDALAAFDPAAGADALNALVWRALTPMVGRVPSTAVARGHPPPGDPDA